MGAHVSVPEVNDVTLSCFIGTWNLGNNVPEDMSWIPKDSFDIYVIGVQEACYVVSDHSKHPADDIRAELHWQSLLDATIGEGYECIAYQTLSPRTDNTYKSEAAFKDAVVKGEAKSSGIRISLYISKRFTGKDTQIEHEVLFQACGRLNCASGNKGGVAINVNLNGTRLCFVNCHLNAHMEQLQRRNEDFETISRYLHQTNDTFGEAKRKLEEGGDLTFEVEVTNRHDVVFWFGDLNYRIQPLTDITKKEEMHDIVCECIDNGCWEELVSYDQLKKQQQQGLVLAHFSEGDLCFPPTFKLNLNPKSSTAKDRYNSKRVPSYCDRILYHYSEATKVNCKSYTRYENVTTSDHLPVMASFDITVPMIVSSKRHTIAKPRVLKLVLRNLILRTEASMNPAHGTSSPVSITIFHRHAKARINTNSCIKQKRVWDGPFVLESDAILRKVLLYPVLFLIRDRTQKEAELHCLGEGMLSLMDLTSRPFKTEVYQGGKPFGLLAGHVQFSLV
eukprot:gene8947-1285_t